MALTMSRLDRTRRTYDVDPDWDGVEVALLAPRAAGPDINTVWTVLSYTPPAATVDVLWAAPDADPSGAIVVPASADVWMRATDAPEAQAVKVERITVLGGGPPLAAPTDLDTFLAALVGNPTSALYQALQSLFGGSTPTHPVAVVGSGLVGSSVVG